MKKMRVADEIEQKLKASFTPEALEITDESEKHRGHAGYQEGGQSHFHVRIAAAPFADMTRLQRHRAVHSALGKELTGRIHALSLDITG